MPTPSWPPTPFVSAIAIVALAVGFVAGLTYYGAREFSGRASDTRASSEAQSFAGHSARLATGDAFNGYIQILRYADDPVVSAKYASANDRSNALQQLLYLNINKFQSLTIADRTGIVFATTDSRIENFKGSTTFSDTRANLSPANSDIILPEAGKHGYVEYTAPLRDTDGSTWGILVGRADPAVLWKETLLAAVDGSQNVIINSQGQFSAGVPDELLRLPWQGVPLPNGAVRANIAGVDSICGLAPIGKDTQIDRGLNVASCLPASITGAEQGGATSKQALITLAAAVFAVVIAAGLLRVLMREVVPVSARSPSITPIAEADSVDEIVEARVEAIVPEPDPAPEPTAESEPEIPLPPPDIDALTLIESYEQRNQRLADRIREQVQAKLLIAATQADEAYKLADTDGDLSSSLHAKAMAELETLRDHELRAIGQELYPGLVRLGLPGALRALKKDLADVIAMKLDMDSAADTVAAGHGRAPLMPAIRLTLYRFVLDAVRLLAVSGASDCIVALKREPREIIVSIAGRPADGEVVDPDALAACVISIEAYAGSVNISEAAHGIEMKARMPAPLATDPAPVAEEDDDEDLSIFADADAQTPEAATEPEPALASVLAPAEASPDPGRGDEAAEADFVDVFKEDRSTTTEANDSPVRVIQLDDGDDAEDDELLAAFGGPSRGIMAQLEALQTELFGSLIVALEVPESVAAADGDGDFTPYARALVRSVVRTGLLVLRAAEAEKASVSLLLDGRMLVVTVSSPGGADAPALATIEAERDAIVAVDGMLLIEPDGAGLQVTARIPAAAEGIAGEDAA